MGKNIKKKKFSGLLLLSAALILAVLGSFGVKGQYEKNTVVLDERGFNPPSLIVRKGTTVTFKATLDRRFWPASDIHPEHAFYSEFDPKQAIEPGENWSFTFDREGSWFYHDHLAPGLKGRIDVIAEDIDVRDISDENKLLAKCKDKRTPGERRKCWENIIGMVSMRDGPKKAYRLYNKLRNQEPEFATYCHDFAHLIGEYFYWRFAGTREFEEMEEADTCSHGFYHGFMREYGHHGRDFLKGADRLCKELQGVGAKGQARPVRLSHCYHGMGHGLIYYYAENYGLSNEGDMVNVALEQCKEMATDDLSARECANGVYLGIYNLYTKSHVYALDINRENPLWWCKDVDPAFIGDCYDQMAPAMMLATGANLKKSVNFYMNEYYPYIPKEALPTVITHLGYVASNGHWSQIQSWDSGEDFYPVVKLCREAKLPRELEVACVKGIAQSIVTRTTTDEAIQRAVDFCQSDMLLYPEERRECYGMIIFHNTRYLTDPSPKIQEICGMVEQEGREHCYSYNQTLNTNYGAVPPGQN